MGKIELVTDENGRGALTAYYVGKKTGSMDIQLTGSSLIAGHTEVEEAFRGTGEAKRLFDYMVDYARKNKLKVQADCPFVYAQFNHNPDLYTDIRLHK